jgi:ADP-ribosylglycohydrolase
MTARSRGEEIEARAGAPLGALVADAAAMGLHWLYDPDRIAAIAEREEPIFLDADRRRFDGVRGYFAHEGKASGELSQYGATLTLAADSLVETGGELDIADYQCRYLRFFGPGGDWKGYIDRPTRGALANLGADVDDDTPEVTGVDDDQLPALSPVPAVVAASPEEPSLESKVERIVRVTNDNALAVEAALIAARLMRNMLRGVAIERALAEEADRAGDEFRPKLREALARKDESSVDVAGSFGRACHVQQGLPVVFHIANRARSYESAVRANILAGGDSCGRAMALGAILGARFGFGGERGVPLPWLTRLKGGARLFDQAYRLASL